MPSGRTEEIMEQDIACVNLEEIALQMTSSLNLNEVLTTITQGIVDELDASFACIWLLGPGDTCKECYKAGICANREKCLHLKASAGLYTNLDGEYRRIPLGKLPVGQIASERKPILSNSLFDDERFTNKEWISENGFCSYGGYPLVFREELLGTIEMFSRNKIQQFEFKSIAGFANQASIAIKNAQLFGEVEKLKNQLQAECTCLREEIKYEHNYDEIIGQSTALKYVLFKVEQIAATDTTVLILGETGTGKELIARAIHSQSARRDRPLVKVNCATLPGNLIESELFGHEKGAFTGAQSKQIGRFELADGANIFLDEIGELPLELQSRLLRVLQDGEFERLGNPRTRKADVRVIAATNRDLEGEVRKGGFRKDLWYRLSVFPITIQPLRERAEDIPLLVEFLVQKLSRKLGKQIKKIPANAIKTLQKYPWPGNVRELENVIERALINTLGSELQLAEKLMTPLAEDLAESQNVSLGEVERDYIVRILEERHWKIEGIDGAARILNLNPSTLRGRIRKLGIRRP
jgi:transcriptional regulator with GAF, ATPase, and Fis domain